MFKVPSGKAGTSLVYEVSHMFQAYAKGSALEAITMKAPMTLSAHPATSKTTFKIKNERTCETP